MVQIKTLQRENSKKLKSISETRRTALLPSGKRLKQGGKTQSLMITNLINGASLTRKKKKEEGCGQAWRKLLCVREKGTEKKGR